MRRIAAQQGRAAGRCHLYSATLSFDAEPLAGPIAGGGGSSGVSAATITAAPLRPASQRRRLWPDLSRFNPARLDLSRIDWAPDLAEDIGSRRWFRGLGTMLGLAALAVSFRPDLTSIDGIPAMPLDADARAALREQAIAPLALGSDTGTRLAPGPLVRPLAAAPERAQIDLAVTLGQGDSVPRMLVRAGADPVDAEWTGKLVGAVMPAGELAPGTRFKLLLGQRPAPGLPRPLESMSFRARFDLELVIARQDGQLQISRRAIPVDSTPLRIRGRVGDGIYLSARAAGLPVEPIQTYLQTLDAHLALDTDIQPDDMFDIVVAWRRTSGGESQPGELLFAGLERNGVPRAQLVRWGTGGQFLEASNAGEQRSGLIMPVVGGRMTSGFGQRRHPVLGFTRMHAGIDFAAPTGSPIYAVTSGTVAYAGWHGGHGNYVKLEHGGGFGTGYAHMSRLAVSPGMSVSAGQVIGYVGSTGLSTGPHLHYELYRGGAKVNPLEVAFTIRAQLEGKELEAFKARLAQLKALNPGMPQPVGAALASAAR